MNLNSTVHLVFRLRLCLSNNRLVLSKTHHMKSRLGNSFMNQDALNPPCPLHGQGIVILVLTTLVRVSNHQETAIRVIVDKFEQNFNILFIIPIEDILVIIEIEDTLIDRSQDISGSL